MKYLREYYSPEESKDLYDEQKKYKIEFIKNHQHFLDDLAQLVYDLLVDFEDDVDFDLGFLLPLPGNDKKTGIFLALCALQTEKENEKDKSRKYDWVIGRSSISLYGSKTDYETYNLLKTKPQDLCFQIHLNGGKNDFRQVPLDPHEVNDALHSTIKRLSKMYNLKILLCEYYKRGEKLDKKDKPSKNCNGWYSYQNFWEYRDTNNLSIYFQLSAK